MIEEILNLYESLQPMNSSKIINYISRKYYRDLPTDDDEFIQFCDLLVCSNNFILYQLMTTWIKRKKTLYQLKYLPTFEKWLYNYTNDWGRCDQFCYRVLNPMIETFPELFVNVLVWSKYPKTYVRRAAAVCLLHSSSSFKVNVPFCLVEEVSNNLKSDSHIHVQKAIGWLLKYSYLSYPDQTISFLINNKSYLNKLTFRYALEKMPLESRSILLNS